MKFYSTNNKNLRISLEEAVMQGLAQDGGLFMPAEIPKMPDSFFEQLHKLSFSEIAFEVGKKLFGNDLPTHVLRNIVNDSFDFPVPLVQLEEDLYVLELFHGPTLAFKDFAARFMARLMGYYINNSNKKLTVLVATSGDTGSAVAHGFLNIPNIRVVILYPSKKVSDIQEKQLTTMGNNITAFEVQGTFDDCQKLVKQSFQDNEMKGKLNLASANSINIARLFPQTFYYFYAYAQLKNIHKEIVISVPSGNFGNLTAGLIAKKMGLPIKKFIAATNSNDVFSKYLNDGVFTPLPSKETLSNAMDVGNPSNFIRILELYNHDINKIRQDVASQSFSDIETKNIIKEVYNKYNYVLDPHGAIGYLGLKDYQSRQNNDFSGIFVETAHPAKFANTVEDILDVKVGIPDRLEQYMNRNKKSILIKNNFDDFKNKLFEI